MNTGTGNLPQEVAEMIDKENRMMGILVSLFAGVIIGLAIGYFLFVQFPWRF